VQSRRPDPSLTAPAPFRDPQGQPPETHPSIIRSLARASQQHYNRLIPQPQPPSSCTSHVRPSCQLAVKDRRCKRPSLYLTPHYTGTAQLQLMPTPADAPSSRSRYCLTPELATPASQPLPARLNLPSPYPTAGQAIQQPKTDTSIWAKLRSLSRTAHPRLESATTNPHVSTTHFQTPAPSPLSRTSRQHPDARTCPAIAPRSAQSGL